MKFHPSEQKVLQLIYTHNGISRKRIAELAYLSQSSITIITKMLLDQQYIVEGGRIGNGMGRKEVLLYANPDKFLFLGIDIGGFRIRITLADNQLNILHEQELLLSQISQDPNRIERLLQWIDQFVSSSLRKPDAIGVGITGIVDPGRQIIMNIPNAEGWDDVKLVELLTDRFDCPVFLEEGGRAMALAEKWIGQAHAWTDFLLVHVGHGLVAGIVSNNLLLRGAHNAAGLLGHVTAEPDGERCLCGNYGCLENIITYPMLQSRYVKAGGQNKSVVDAYKQKDKIALDVCVNGGMALGITLSNAVNLLNPQAIYIGGQMFEDMPILYEETKRTINLRGNRFATMSLQLGNTSYGTKQGIMGALLVAKHSLIGM
jgi:N-acetylglucosamine repressor